MFKFITAIITLTMACAVLAQPVVPAPPPKAAPLKFSTGVLGTDKYSVLFRELGRACGTTVDIVEFASTGDQANLKAVAAGATDVAFVRSDVAGASLPTLSPGAQTLLRTLVVLYPVNPATPQVKVLLLTRAFELKDPQAQKLAKLRTCITGSISDLKSAGNASPEWNLVNPTATVASPSMYVSPLR